MTHPIDDLHRRMSELDAERETVKNQLDRERLTRATNSVIETITSPEFVQKMREFRERAAAGEIEPEQISQLLSIEGLREAGAELPDDFRLSSRTFEDLESGTRIEIKPGRLPGDLSPVAWGACAGGGAATVCGCAGGST